MKRWPRTRKPSHSSRGGLLADQLSVFIHAQAGLSSLASTDGASLAGDRHRLTSVGRGIITIVNVAGRR